MAPLWRARNARSIAVRATLAFAIATLFFAVGFVLWHGVMPLRSHQGPLLPLTPGQQALSARLRGHVEAIVDDARPRTLFGRTLDRTVSTIQSAMKTVGVSTTDHVFEVAGLRVVNIEVEIRGTTAPNEVVVVGAHYDTALSTPGADDNASGVAALVELVRMASASPTPRTRRFVFFANEEPPYFQTEHMGSFQYATHVHARGDHVVAMISVESIGYFDDRPKSQKYPAGFSLFYPNRGDFIAFVGALRARTWIRRAISAFRETTPFPSEGLAAPMRVPGIGWSDHWAFAKLGYPAIMVTDTAPFRNPHYHAPSDLPDTLDYDRMARVVSGIHEVIIDFSGGRTNGS